MAPERRNPLGEGKIIKNTGDLCSVIRSHRAGDKLNIAGYGQFTNDTTGDTFYDNYTTAVKVVQ